MNDVIEMSLLQNKADQWDKQYKLVLNQNNGMTTGSKRNKLPGGYFANMSDFEKNAMAKWEQGGAIAAYPNIEERRRAWLMHRRGTTDVRQFGAPMTDKEYSRHLASSGIENPYRKKLNQKKQALMSQVGQRNVPTQEELRKAYKSEQKSNRRTMSVYGKKSSESNLSPMEKLAKEYQDKMDEANAKNEERYKEIEKQLQDRHMRGVEGVRGWEDAELLRNAEKFEEDRGNIAAKYESNTTVGDAFRARANRDERMSATDIRSDAQQRATLMDMQLDKDLADFRERREDVAPDMNVMLRLAQEMGKGNDGKGFRGEPAGETPVQPGTGGSAGATGSSMQQAAQNYRPTVGANGPPRAANPYGGAVNSFFGAPRARPQNIYSGVPTGAMSPQQMAQRIATQEQQARAAGMGQNVPAPYFLNKTGYLTASQRMQRDAARRQARIDERKKNFVPTKDRNDWTGDVVGDLMDQGF